MKVPDQDSGLAAKVETLTQRVGRENKEIKDRFEEHYAELKDRIAKAEAEISKRVVFNVEDVGIHSDGTTWALVDGRWHPFCAACNEHGHFPMLVSTQGGTKLAECPRCQHGDEYSPQTFTMLEANGPNKT